MKRDIEEEEYIYKVPCQPRETISLRDSTYVSNKQIKKKKGHNQDDMGDMKELPDYPKAGDERSSEKSYKEVEMDPRRQSYTSSTVGELNFGSFPLASLNEKPKKQQSK
jgi:hypothetical protein